MATKVLGVPYRPPGLVAKMAETFDRLSGGRLILGLGGGSSDAEFRPIDHTNGATVAPPPEHRIPIWLGTFGNRALAVTGELADGWIPSLGFAHQSR